MPCYYPLTGYKSKVKNDSGKHSVVFNTRDGDAAASLKLPCGRCVGCRLERSRQWAVRIMHEASLYRDNCFITLTYDDAHLPYVRGTDVPTLVKKDFQDFMKRFRARFQGTSETSDGLRPIRFYACGEYGDKTDRPHYHACIFNFRFPDEKPLKKCGDFQLYTSDKLLDLWQHKGHVSIGTLTFDSAAYVARYIMKKRLGDDSASYYDTFIDLETGEVLGRQPEYCDMSRRPGIGTGWIARWHTDVYPSDEVIFNAKSTKPAKFYDKWLAAQASNNMDMAIMFDEVMANRVEAFKNVLDEQTQHRLDVRERCTLHRLKVFSRKL